MEKRGGGDRVSNSEPSPFLHTQSLLESLFSTNFSNVSLEVPGPKMTDVPIHLLGHRVSKWVVSTQEVNTWVVSAQEVNKWVVSGQEVNKWVVSAQEVNKWVVSAQEVSKWVVSVQVVDGARSTMNLGTSRHLFSPTQGSTSSSV